MKRIAFIAGIVVTGAAGAGLAYAFAGDPAPRADAAQGRYVMHATEKGFVRLDTVSGEVSTCLEEGDNLVCRLAADDRTAYEAQIAALATENDALRAGGHAAQTLGEDAAEAATQGALNGDLPSVTEIDEAIGLVEYVVKRLVGAARTISDEIEGSETQTPAN